MNYNNANNITAVIKKIAKFLFSFCVLSSALLFVFYPPQTSSSTLPDCTEIQTNIQPGNNCLFNGQKLCSAIPSTSYTISSSNIASNPINRYNCFDLIDLPLCSQMPVGDDIPDEFKALPGQNCVKDCNDASFSGQPGEVRGADFAVHKRDCIRFCDAVSAENTAFGSNIAQNSTTCTSRKCNQMYDNTGPSPGSNCDNLSCNLLSVYELIDVSAKLNNLSDDNSDDSTNNFCNGETDLNDNVLKCYKFSSDQLPYVIRDRMCKIHNCTPICSEYHSTTDENGDGVIDTKDDNDVVNVTNQGASYTEVYETYIKNGSPITDNSYCNKIICKPIIHRTYRCTTNGEQITGEDSRDTVRNNNCDSTGDGAICSGNYCYKEIDCNKSEFAGEPECTNSGGDDDSIGSTEDTMDSWFYRPRPMDIATNGDGTLKSPMGSGGEELCYTKSQLKTHSDSNSNKHCDVDGGRWGKDLSFQIPLPWGGHLTIPLGYFHSSLCPDQTRSPGLCGDHSYGFRGNGYIYLCYGDGNDNSGNMYSKVSEETAYYKGYVKSSYTDGDGVHKVVLCLRFRNGLRPDDGSSETCGKRQCAISCMGFAGGCSSENCGYDVCKELTIKDSKPDECKMDDEIFNNDRDRECMATIDPASTIPVRLRIQKYGNKICGFLDVKGQLAYETDFFVRGNERTANGYCLDGTISDSCHSKDTGSIPGEATKWRTMNFAPHIPYIKNNQTSSAKFKGYMDKFGQIYEEQDCIKVPMRVPPPTLYNIANSANMPKLSIPPIYITNSMIKKGGSISPSSNGEYGVTDFHEPELEVRFGNNTKKLSLSADKTGYEENNRDENSYATITTTVNSIEYSEDVFVRKEHDSDSKQPIFCLLQEISAPDGSYIPPKRIGCVRRGIPPISSATQKLLILGASENTFETAEIILRYVSSFGNNNTYDGCSGDDTCTSEVSIINPDPKVPTCSDSVEKYQVCAQRDECSKLNSECMANEIAIQNAKVNGDPYSSLLLIRNNCNDYLLPYCNLKKGISSSTTTSMMTDTNLPAINNRYGWFNEICFVGSGKTDSFDGNRKKVFAYKSEDDIDGKCIVSMLSPYLTDGNPATNCDEGGKAPNCLCIEYLEGMALEEGEEARLETRREAGLCVDFPIPETCPAVVYNTTPNSNTADPDYVSFSLDNMTYGTVNSVEEDNVVHLSHKYRTEGVGHAEFPIAVMGMNSIEGTCSGFWKNNASAYGISQSPIRDCKNVSGSAEWDSVVTNECVRYKCPQISTSNPNSSGDYPGEYGASETATNKGLSNGYAMWNSYTKTNDFLETVTASYCINGFKKVGATAVTNDNVITSYTGGTLPQRTCNQIGQWGGTITNACQRITCSAVNPPSNPVSNADWDQWNTSGGATFAQINASRSSVEVLSESIQSGVCNTNLGFYQLGSEPPKRKCDYLGNWLTVENPCTTRCQAVTLESDAKSINHGYGYWNEANPPVGTSYLATSTGCVAGYVPYPYPPINNSDGIKHTIAGTSYRGKTYKLSDTGVNYDDIIPLTVNLDTRTISPLPQRWCKLVVADGVSSNYWYAASSQCINRCPGYDSDNRIGVGVTKHNTRNGQISINWTSAPLNTWVFINSNSVQTETTPDLTGHDASLYSTQNRTNGRFILARKCGANGKWEDPIPQCVTNSGVITGSNATYDTSNSGRPNSKAIDVGDTSLGRAAGIATSASCIAGGIYYQTGKDTGTLEPISDYTCEYSDDVQKNIDQTYFKYKSGSQCQVYCKATGSTHFGSPDGDGIYKSIYDDGGTAYTKNGSYLTLECNEDDGYGRVVLGTEGSTNVTSCGRSSKERSATPPKALCNSDGSWGSITNQCEACRSCTKSSEWIGSDITTNPDRSCNNGYNGTASEILGECNDNDVNLNTSSGNSITISHKHERRCNCDSVCAFVEMTCKSISHKLERICDCDSVDRTVCAFVEMTCKDGKFDFISWSQGDGDSSDNWTCNSKQCATSSQSRGNDSGC